MSQHDFEIANQGFPSFRSDLNSGLQALASNSAGATEPSTTYAYQMWYDETTDILKMRNGDDDAWITLAFFDQTNDEWEVRSAVIQAVDSGGVQIKTDEGTARITVADNGDVTIANDLSISDKIVHTGDTNTAIRFPANDTVTIETGGSEHLRVTSAGLVGINTESPSNFLHVNGQARIANTLFLEDNDTIRRLNDSGNVNISGGSATNSGANYALFGDSHPSLASIHRWRIGGTEQMRLDASGNLQFNSGYGSSVTAYGCRAWVNFNGTGTVAIRESGNVSSITDNGTADYTVNFATAMPDASYSVGGSVSFSSSSFGNTFMLDGSGFATSGFVFKSQDNDSDNLSNGGFPLRDALIACAHVFR